MSALVKVETRVCRTCNEEKPKTPEYFKFDKDSVRRKCKTCSKAACKPEFVRRQSFPPRACKVCGVARLFDDFGTSRWRAFGPCLACKPRRQQIRREDSDVAYDMGFALCALGMTFEQALEWVMRGYGFTTPEGVVRHLHSRELRQWEPDPV